MAHQLLVTFPDAKTRIEFLSKLDNDLWSDTYGEDWQHLLKMLIVFSTNFQSRGHS